MRSHFFVVAFLLACPPARLAAQRSTASFNDLILVRNRPYAENTLLELRLGAAGGIPNNEDESRLAETRASVDGHVYYRQQQAFGRQNRFEVYVGRDGAYVSLTEGDPKVDKGYTRLELFGRQWGNYIREGFYQGNDFVPVGLYESRDWRVRLSLASKFSGSIRAEGMAYYGKNAFKPYSRTNPAFTLPKDYSVYGIETIVEDNTLQLDRQTGLPYQGYILAAWFQIERTTSDDEFGLTGRLSSLPDQVIRGGGHLEWYFPYTNTGTFILTADVGLSPDGDRVVMYEPTKPLGQWWGDGMFEFRFLLGDIFTITPGVRVQYSRIFDQFAAAAEDKIFFGGQLRVRANLLDQAAFELEYSFLTNESRRPVGLDRDSIGQHRMWFGVIVRL